MRTAFCLLFLAAGAFAQQPGSASAPLTTGPGEAALRARVAQFYQYFVEGHFRLADALVADDSKDAFFAEEKLKYRFCNLGKTTIAPDGKTAVAVTSCGTTYAFHGQRIPTTMPMTTNWELQNGDWFWHSVPFDGNAKTPFGNMKVDPNGEHQAQRPIPANPGEMTPGMLSGVRANKTSVTLPRGKPGHEEVEIENNMPGPVRLRLAHSSILGLKIELSPALLGARQKAIVSLDYSPTNPALAHNIVVKVLIAPTQQMIPIQVNFSEVTTESAK